jgi:hypothetical protein
MKAAQLSTGATGRALLIINKRSLFTLLRVRALLQLRHGFHREGRRWFGCGEGVAPDFVRGALRLEAGFESMLGFTLHATSAESDAFLRRFAAKDLHLVA